jgi:hypothetical protein
VIVFKERELDIIEDWRLILCSRSSAECKYIYTGFIRRESKRQAVWVWKTSGDNTGRDNNELRPDMEMTASARPVTFSGSTIRGQYEMIESFSWPSPHPSCLALTVQ